jgi:hypothetical protein
MKDLVEQAIIHSKAHPNVALHCLEVAQLRVEFIIASKSYDDDVMCGNDGCKGLLSELLLESSGIRRRNSFSLYSPP